ncbi:MAG: SDR family oxidoreductase [Sphingomonadaceae bacterium]|uniref:SDR family NAD(P)-dependent oxidoreductase n=1 Tax=Thermaurantiacus sp. TaxID=2820283 RepID=UPI00298F1C7B|nr:SDR family oxidoreductase [Thermaurantiacus sp.]MCS6987159.1 SDR family oxidoreductase [Sphingomonadaceae bacterium]MDW8415807.1 SDR family oxidoreductase [Thermaurantiacus sp.]
MSAPFAGRAALVTGAASGIGRATAALLAARGAMVLGTDLKAAEGLFPHDVTQEAQWEAAVAECVRRFGRLDILVHCAGTAQSGPIAELSLETFRAQAQVHVEAAFVGARLAVAQMRAQGRPARGAIVFVGSIAGLKPVMQTTAYGTAKAALIHLARTLGVELGRKGDLVRVNAVCPGGTRTPMTEAAFPPEYWDDPANFAHLPLKAFCTPEDIAEAIAFLASEEAEFVTAQALVVDGGWLVGSRP